MPEWLDLQSILHYSAASALALVVLDTVTLGRLTKLVASVPSWGGDAEKPDAPANDSELSIQEAYDALGVVEQWGKGREGEFAQGVALIRNNWLSPKAEGDGQP